MQEGLPNTVAPNKRPFHTLIPGFITKPGPSGQQEPWLAFGVMGGAIQAQAHAQFVINLLEFGMDLQQAMDAPRFRHNSGLGVALEAPIPDSIRAALERLGHHTTPLAPGNAGGSQAVMRLTRGWAAASDPRKDGHAAGW
jgi:gamma-glutamyltranspeptidase/glutathione hydrolase